MSSLNPSLTFPAGLCACVSLWKFPSSAAASLLTNTNLLRDQNRTLENLVYTTPHWWAGAREGRLLFVQIQTYNLYSSLEYDFGSFLTLLRFGVRQWNSVLATFDTVTLHIF